MAVRAENRLLGLAPEEVAVQSMVDHVDLGGVNSTRVLVVGQVSIVVQSQIDFGQPRRQRIRLESVSCRSPGARRRLLQEVRLLLLLDSPAVRHQQSSDCYTQQHQCPQMADRRFGFRSCGLLPFARSNRFSLLGRWRPTGGEALSADRSRRLPRGELFRWGP
jgi:hypothetical protein